MKTRLLAILTIIIAAAILTSVAFYSKLAIYISIIAIGLAHTLQRVLQPLHS